MNGDPAFIAVLLVIAALVIGLLVYFVLERRLDLQIEKLTSETVYRFECTCGWHGWREFKLVPLSINCPRCNGIAVHRNYREREL